MSEKELKLQVYVISDWKEFAKIFELLWKQQQAKRR